MHRAVTASRFSRRAGEEIPVLQEGVFQGEGDKLFWEEVPVGENGGGSKIFPARGATGPRAGSALIDDDGANCTSRNRDSRQGSFLR